MIKLNDMRIILLDKGLVVLYALVASLGLITLKLGTPGGLVSNTNGTLAINFNAFAIVGILLYGVSFALYLILISRHQLGLIVSFTASLVYLIVFLASFFIFNEEFTLIKVAAIVLILGGLVVLNLPDKANR
mgnify:CR=1 FL=1